MTLSLRCASDSYKFELASDITSDGSNISGSWNETTRGVVGSLSGRATASNIQATANAVGFNASLAIHSSGNSLSVLIRSPGSEISEVSVSCRAKIKHHQGKRGRGAQVRTLKSHVFRRYMNAANFAAVAVAAGLLAFAIPTRRKPPMGRWRNLPETGRAPARSPSRTDRANASAAAAPTLQAAKHSTLNLRCASDSYKFELASDIASEGSNISGSWNETTRGVVGSLSGRATASNIQATAKAVGFSARWRSAPAAIL